METEKEKEETRGREEADRLVRGKVSDQQSINRVLQ